MKKFVFIITLNSLWINNINSQNELNPTEEKSGISPEAKAIIENTTGAESDTGAVIHLREAEMTVDEGGLFSVTYHVIGQIFDEKAKEDYNQIPVTFNSYYEDLKLDYARTIDSDESFIEVSKDAIQIKTYPDYFGVNTYTDSKIIAFSLPALKPGKFFEYQLTAKMKLHMVANYWFESFGFNYVLYSLSDPYYLRIDPVKLSRFTLSVSETESFRAEVINAEIDEEKKIENGMAIYTWELQDLPSFKLESRMPSLYEVMPLITVSSIPDWKIFGDWVYSIISSEISVSEILKMKASELTADEKTSTEKIKKLYDYVRTEVDYIQADLDRGGLKPHSADDVLRNKYGDCKDQVVLLLSLLQAVNITAYPALISTYSYREHQKFLPTQYFDHLIVFVQLDSVEFWLDPTSELDAYPHLGYNNQNRWSLVLDENDVRFMLTPSVVSEKNIGIFNLTMNAHDDSLSGIIEMEGLGVFNDYFSSLLEYYSKSEFENFLKELFDSYFYQVAKVQDINHENGLNYEDGYKQFMTFDYLQPTKEYTLFHYSSSISLAFVFFSITLPFEEERRFDYVFPFKFTLKGNELLIAPWKYSLIKNCPESDSVINNYFSFKQVIEEFQDSVLIRWEFNLNENFVSKEDYMSFVSDVLKVEEMTGWQIDFQKQLGVENLLTNLSAYFGVDLDSTLISKEYIPPSNLNDLNINPDIKKEIVAVIEGYILALNDGDQEVALELLSKDNPESKSVKRYSDKDYSSLGISFKVENINVIDVIYDYALASYTTLMELEKYPEIGPFRFEYLSILNNLDHHWKIYRSRVKNYIDNCTLYSTVAYDYYKKDDYNKALVIFDLAMANDSTCTYAFGSVGWIYYLKGDYQKCIEYSQKTIALDSTALYAQYNIALSYLCLGEFEKAKLKYEQTIELNEDLDEEIHAGAIQDLENLIRDNFKKAEAEIILEEYFDVEDVNKSVPANAQ